MLEQFRTVGGMFHFGMELHGEILAGEIAHGGDGAVARSCQGNKSLRHAGNPVAVRHPDLGYGIQHGAGDQRLDVGGPILALAGVGNFASQGMGQQLHAVAQAEDG